MGLFFYNKIGSIIPMVVLPTTEIIEPHFALPFFYLENKYCNFQTSFTKILQL